MMRYLLRPCWLVGLCFVAAACDAGTPEAPPPAAQAQVPSAVSGEPTAVPPVLVALEPMPSSSAAPSTPRLPEGPAIIAGGFCSDVFASDMPADTILDGTTYTYGKR